MFGSSVIGRFLHGQRTILNSINRFLVPDIQLNVQTNRNYFKLKETPKPGIKGKSYRRIVHFKDKYTIKPLEVTNLGGRDPVSGMLKVSC